jgi:hypothetical protein
LVFYQQQQLVGINLRLLKFKVQAEEPGGIVDRVN